MALGHEIHILRVIIFDLLCKGLISQNDIIITMKDRKFFYEKIFSNTSSIEEARTKDFSHRIVLDINPYRTTLLFDTIPILKQFNFYSISEIMNKFKYIFIHHRHDTNFVYLHIIINKIDEKYFIINFLNFILIIFK